MIGRRERGEGNVGCMLWLLVVILVGMVLWKAIPIKVKNTELYDYMVELTRFASNKTGEDLKKMVLKRAEELELPVSAKQVTVNKGKDRIRIQCTYTIPLEFPGYTYYWKVEHEVDRPIFYL